MLELIKWGYSSILNCWEPEENLNLLALRYSLLLIVFMDVSDYLAKKIV
jgi:hypothetical protein